METPDTAPTVLDEIDASGLPAAPAAAAPGTTPPAPAASDPPAIDPTKYVSRELYDAQVARMDEMSRRITSVADVAAPGSVAATAPAPTTAPVPLTPQQIEQLRNKLVENPAEVILPLARGVAQQMVEQQMAPVRAQSTRGEIRGFMADKRASNPDEYKLVEPYLQKALGAIPLATLAQQQPEQLEAYLEVTYRACRGDMYAEKQAAPGTGALPAGATAADALPTGAPGTAQAEPPPYSGAAGAPAQAATSPVTRMVQKRKLTDAELDLAKRSGITQEDMKKYGTTVLNELTG